MNTKSLDIAVREARRFLDVVRCLKDAEPGSVYVYGPSKESGAVKRASLDLTRALANMRRPS